MNEDSSQVLAVGFAFLILVEFMKRWIVLFCVGVFWVGCRSHSDPVMRIDMSEIRGEIDVKFSDIATECRLVRLETKPEALLEGWFKIWGGDRYIVTYGNEEMHLFSAGGSISAG